MITLKKFWETFYDKMVANLEKGKLLICNQQNMKSPVFLPTQS